MDYAQHMFWKYVLHSSLGPEKIYRRVPEIEATALCESKV